MALGAVLALPSAGRALEPACTVLGTSGRRFVGRLTTTDPQGHEAALRAIRVVSGYARPLTYASTDRLKLPFALAAIDHVAEAHDLSFVAEEVANPARLPAVGTYPELEQLAAFLTGCAYGATTVVRQGDFEQTQTSRLRSVRADPDEGEIDMEVLDYPRAEARA